MPIIGETVYAFRCRRSSSEGLAPIELPVVSGAISSREVANAAVIRNLRQTPRSVAILGTGLSARTLLAARMRSAPWPGVLWRPVSEVVEFQLTSDPMSGELLGVLTHDEIGLLRERIRSSNNAEW